jgi:hypothetical protein
MQLSEDVPELPMDFVPRVFALRSPSVVEKTDDRGRETEHPHDLAVHPIRSRRLRSLLRRETD